MRIHVVRTPHQAERAPSSDPDAGELQPALSLGPLCRRLALGDEADTKVAGRAEVWIATRDAVERAGLAPGDEATAERRTAIVAAYDAAVGWALRTGAIPGGSGSSTARVASDVRATLERARLRDARGLAWLARAAREDRAPELRDVLVTGVVPGEIDTIAAIEALHLAARRHGGGAKIVLPRPEESFADDAANDGGGALAAHLERRWGALDDAPEIEWLPERERAKRIERIEAPSATAEAREAVAAVARAVASGVAPEDVAVVVPRMDDPLAQLVTTALAEAGIPVAREGGDPIDASPEVAVTLDLLAMAAGRITRDGLADLLRAPGLHAGSWVGEADEVEAARVATSIAHRLRSIPVAVDRAGGARVVEALEGVDPRAAVVVARLCAQTAAVGAQRGRGPLAQSWRELAHRVRLGRPSASELAAALRGEAKERRGGSRFASARLRAIGEGARGTTQVLAAATALADAETRLGLHAADVDAAELLAEVRELVRSATAGPPGGAPRAGAVRVATARDVVGLRHALVVVTGLGANAHGASEVRGIVDEAALAALPELHRPPPLAARRAARAMELRWIARDAEHLVLTRRAGGARGHDEAPHPLFVDLGRESSGTSPAAPLRAPASSLLPAARPITARDHLRLRLAAGAGPSVASGALGETIAAAHAANEERTRFFLDPRAQPGRFSGALVAGSALARRFGGDAPERSIAVTHIERAARCAFAGFASRVLRARRVEDALEDANPRERGTLVHGALFAAYEAMRAAPPSEDVASLRARAERAALDHTRAEQATPLRREAILAAVRDAMAVVDLELASGDAAFYALGERRFGSTEAPPWDALCLAGADDDGGADVWVDGQIDRVDRPADARWARIVDYKTGKLPRKKDEHQRSLQLSIYADAVRRWLAATSGGSAEISGRYVESKRGAARVRDVEVDEDARRTARHAARRVVLSLWSGDVGARVADPRACRRCEARDVCRKPAVAVDDDLGDGEVDAPGDGAKA